MKVVVVDYDPQWARDFEALRARIWRHVDDFAISIEHVGSTAVPGLAAKPILDVDIVVGSQQAVLLAIERLTALRYAYQGNMGIEGREAFRAAVNVPAHNLYVCRDDSAALQDHIRFRDYLRAHPETAQAYTELKRVLAGRFPNDVDSYAQAKTDFVTHILETAGADRNRIDHIRRENGL